MPTGHFFRTPEHRKHISESLKGKEHPWIENKKVERSCPCGKVFITTLGRVKEGKGNYCNRTCYYKYRKNPSLSLKRGRGEESHNWKGNNVGYSGLHLWVENERGKPSFCEHCKRTDRKRYEWANVSKQYKRELSDWIRLCKSCHFKYDNLGEKIWKTKRERYHQYA